MKIRKNKTRMFRLLFEQSGEAMLIRAGNELIDGNPAAVELFGCSDRNQLLKLNPSELSPEKQMDGTPSDIMAQTLIDRAVEQGGLRFEWLHRRVNGQVFPAEVLLTSISHGSEQILYATIRDVIEKKQAEEKLEHEQSLRIKFIQSAPAFFVAIDRYGKIIMMNDAMLQATGYELEGVLGQEYLSRLVPAEERDAVARVFDQLLTTSEATQNENHLLTRDGRRLWVEWHGRSVCDTNGALDYFFGVGIDITERRRAEQRLQAALVEVQRLKDRIEEEKLYLQEEIKLAHNFEEIIGVSEPLKNTLAKVEQVVDTDSTVLILGETGTGKELIARAVHNFSRRRAEPLVKVNCAALPANLIESELFGHEKGAFTGAFTRKIGRFELADRGTLFLDEIGDLPLELQAKLLRVLQDGKFERLGNPRSIKVNVRVIAATNRDMEKAVANGSFREDLYYRLNVFPIKLPALRERKPDIPYLVDHFLKKYSQKIGKKIEGVPKGIMTKLLAYDWPGNIRELENIIERAVIVNQGSRLEAGDWLPKKSVPESSADLTTLEQVERAHIVKVLEATRWRVSGENGAAKILGLNSNTLVSRMKKLNIQR